MIRRFVDTTASILLLTSLVFPSLVLASPSPNRPSPLPRLSNPIPSEPPAPFHFDDRSEPLLAGINNISQRFISTATSAGLSIASNVATFKASLSFAPPPNYSQPNGVIRFDFDGDGKAEIGRWQSSSQDFKLRLSNGGSLSSTTIGTSTSKVAPGDFDGDGKTDVAVFAAGTWTIKKSSNGASLSITLGTSGDIPVAADYDGDGTTDAAVFRPSNYTWYVKQSSTGNTTSTAWGASTDIPVPGNYDGDGIADIAVYRPSTGVWYVLGVQAVTLTAPGDMQPILPCWPTLTETRRPTFRYTDHRLGRGMC